MKDIDSAALALALGQSYDTLRGWLKRGFISKKGRRFTYAEAMHAAVFGACARHYGSFGDVADIARSAYTLMESDVFSGRTSNCVVGIAEVIDGRRTMFIGDSGATDGAWGSVIRALEDERSKHGLRALSIIDMRADVRRVCDLIMAAEAETQEDDNE